MRLLDRLFGTETEVKKDLPRTVLVEVEPPKVQVEKVAIPKTDLQGVEIYNRKVKPRVNALARSCQNVFTPHVNAHESN